MRRGVWLLLALSVFVVAACGRSGDAGEQPAADAAKSVKSSPFRLVDLHEDEALARVAESSKSGDVAGLTELVSHRSRKVAEGAANELAKLGPAAAAAAPALASLIPNQNQGDSAAVSASRALAAIGRAAVPTLMKLLAAADPQARSLALRTLNEIDSAALEAAVPAYMARRLESGTKGEPSFALQSLAEIGAGALAAAVPVFIERLERESPAERGLAVRTLGDIGPPAMKAIPALVALSKGNDDELSREAAAALVWIDPGTYDPNCPRDKLAPWTVLAKRKNLPAPNRLALEKRTAVGMIAVLDSRRRQSNVQRTRHSYLLGLSGSNGVEALVGAETTESFDEEQDAELTVHEIEGTPLAVEVIVDCTDHPHYPYRLGVLLALPSLKRLAGFTAIDSSNDGPGKMTHIEIEKSERAGTAEVLLVTTSYRGPEDEGGSIEKKLVKRIPLSTPDRRPRDAGAPSPASR